MFSFNKFMSIICFILGWVVCLSPMLGVPYSTNQTVIFLLGLIGFALFQIVENTAPNNIQGK